VPKQARLQPVWGGQAEARPTELRKFPAPAHGFYGCAGVCWHWSA
jgi:hypothetical protein